jgi:hypothetical protein
MAEWKSGRRCVCPGCHCAWTAQFGGIATTVLLALIDRIVGWLISSARRAAQVAYSSRPGRTGTRGDPLTGWVGGEGQLYVLVWRLLARILHKWRSATSCQSAFVEVTVPITTEDR